MIRLLKTSFISMILLFALIFTGQSQDNSDEYRKTIEMADSYFTKGDYINAKASYQIAVRLAPAEQYPKDRLQQSLDMIKVQMYQNSLYTQKIQVADILYEKKDLTAALVVYQEALSILPGDVYASGRVQEITRNQLDSQQIEENYQKSINSGDQFFKENKLDNALVEYRNALALKPSEAYPREKAILVENMIAEGKNITDEYEKYLQDADLAVSRNKYDEAINYLESAINLMPAEPLPKQKLAEAQNLKAAWDSYASIINEADEYYISKDFQLAKDKYLQAQSIKPADEYPKRMLEKIDIAMMDLEHANRSSYEFTIELADKLFNQEEYEQAMVEYKNALRFKPDEEYAKQRINDINKALSLRKSQEDAYTQSIAKADNLYKEESFEEARDEYNRAIAIKPLEQYPKVKVDEINTKLSILSGQRELYNNLIKGADRLFFSDEYLEAREQYREAGYLFPKERYPQDQITMINEILGLRDKYVKAVTKADQLLFSQDLEGALLEFRNAAAIDPKEAYPLQKIKEIETMMAAQAKQKEEEDRKRAAIEKEEEEIAKREYEAAMLAYQQQQIFELKQDSIMLAEQQALEIQYQDAVTAADNALNEKDYQGALAGYQAALGLKPGENHPQGKIDEINEILGEFAAKEALDKQYQDAVAAADKALLAKDYQGALAGYQAALGLKTGESYPQGKIDEINKILGEEIAAKDALEKQYQDAIAAADKDLQEKDYQGALAGYQAALGLKPGESYPQDKIAEINTALGEIAAKEALDKQYQDAVAAADKALQAKDYQGAMAGYQAALGLKPGESYPQDKIAEINTALGEIAAREALDKQYQDAVAAADKALLAKNYQEALAGYQAALGLKPGESYPQGKIDEINAVLGEIAAKEALDKQYLDAIAAADKALLAKNYQEAMAGYQAALGLKTGESYPQGKIDEINALLGEIAAMEALDKQYQDAIAAADKALLAKDYDKAVAGYQAALSLKTGESYPNQKITEIEAAREAIRKQKELDNQYNKAIASADEYLKNEQFEEAKNTYQQALAIKPGEDYPGRQIILIDHTLQKQEEQRDQSYQAAITKADNYFSLEDYEMAKLHYNRAIELKPDELYPLDKLKIVNEQIMKKRQMIQEEYDKGIADADKFFASKIYDNALDSYRAASIQKPEEEYPKEMIRRILKLLSERSIVQINKDPLLILNNTLHKFDFIPVPAKDRKSNYIFFRARNVSDHEYKLIISFGKDQTKNGGIVIKVPAGEDLYEYIVRISAQYKWFSDDNNWISFYPEGGDFEVALMQISYSD